MQARDEVLLQLYKQAFDNELKTKAQKLINTLYDYGKLRGSIDLSFYGGNTLFIEIASSIDEYYNLQVGVNRLGFYTWTLKTKKQDFSGRNYVSELPEIIKKYIYLQPIKEDIDLQFDSLTDYTDAYCPHCKEVSTYDHESLPWIDDEEQELTCNMCDKEFITMVSITYTRSSRFKDGE